MRLCTIASAALLGFVLFSVAFAQEPADQSPELKVLNPLIGTWDEVITNKSTEWMPKAGRATSVTKGSWALGGRFVRVDGIMVFFLRWLEGGGAAVRSPYRLWADATGNYAIDAGS
jgi:hypothetical protein